jgi:RimJ/RimL family protein N-acetyltransferase
MEPSVRLDAADSADIQGEKTRLRPMRLDEARKLHEWSLDPDVRPFWGSGIDDFDEFLRHYEPHYFDGSQPERGRFFTIEADGRPIGMINYNRLDTENRCTDIDVVVGDAGYRDRGYGADAIRAFLGFLFDTVGLHRVWLGTVDHNTRARHVYEKLGFVQEGVMRRSDLVDGRWVDSVIYGILEDEYRGR